MGCVPGAEQCSRAVSLRDVAPFEELLIPHALLSRIPVKAITFLYSDTLKTDSNIIIFG